MNTTRLKPLQPANLLFLFFFSSICMANPPWQAHGPLAVSTSKHVLAHQDGSPMLWIGDTGWGMFQQLKRKEVDHYLDRRKKQGFTVIQSVAFWYPHGGGIPSGPHNAANAYGHRPFTGGEDAPNTSVPLIVEDGSVLKPNDYWDHANYVVEAVRKRGMWLALLPCWGRAYITQEFNGSHHEFTREESKAYGLFLGKRYQEEPHIIWIMGGDAKAKKESYDKRDIFRAMAEGIVQGVTEQSPAWNQAHPAWDKLILTYHPDGHPTLNSSSWFHQDAWLTANGVEVWGKVDEVYPVMAHEYQLENPTKPSLFLEGSYEYGSYQHKCGWVTPLRIRRQFYHTFFAGGAGHTYGAGPVWAMRGKDGNYNCGFTWQAALDFPGAKQLATIGKQFLQKHDWSNWIPAQSVIVKGIGEGQSLKTAVHHSKGQQTLIYFSNRSIARIRNGLGRPCQSHWFDPRNGQVTPCGKFKADETRRMIPPEQWEDAILVLEAK